MSTFLIINQVKKIVHSHLSKYLHAKIASLSTVKSCVTVGPTLCLLTANVWPCVVAVDELSTLLLAQ